MKTDGDITDNRFMKLKTVRGLLDRCKKLLHESGHYKALHFRIPICIGYANDLKPVEFKAFIEQIQAIIGKMNEEIKAADRATTSDAKNDSQPTIDAALHEYTFYLYPNEYDLTKSELWKRANQALIDSLRDSGHLVDLTTVRASPAWLHASQKYEHFIKVTDEDKALPKVPSDERVVSKAHTSLPSVLLAEDATRFLDSLKKQKKSDGVSLAKLIEITQQKVIDVLSWGIPKHSKDQKASVVLHYATPSKAMLNIFPYLEYLGYVPHSTVYHDFKKNNDIKLEEQPRSLTLPDSASPSKQGDDLTTTVGGNIDVFADLVAAKLFERIAPLLLSKNLNAQQEIVSALSQPPALLVPTVPVNSAVKSMLVPRVDGGISIHSPVETPVSSSPESAVSVSSDDCLENTVSEESRGDFSSGSGSEDDYNYITPHVTPSTTPPPTTTPPQSDDGKVKLKPSIKEGLIGHGVFAQPSSTASAPTSHNLSKSHGHIPRSRSLF